VVLEQMLAGVGTWRFSRTREPVGEEVCAFERSASKSAVSREFVGRARERLGELMSRDLQDVRLTVLMVDGIELKGRCCIVAPGISTEGVKIPLGLWDGSTENKTVTAHLLVDLVDRGLDVEQGVFVVLDGGKALRAAVGEVFGAVPVQRCVRHKERNVLDHLPERPESPWALEEDARLDEPDRVHDRDHPPHLAQREALAVRGHVPTLDRRRDARGRAGLVDE
jgi:transposase-like protein